MIPHQREEEEGEGGGGRGTEGERENLPHGCVLFYWLPQLTSVSNGHSKQHFRQTGKWMRLMSQHTATAVPLRRIPI